MEENVCWVCCKEMKYRAVGVCGHNDVCMMCNLRMRLLLNNNKCPLCNMEQDRILITSNPYAKLEDFPTLSTSATDKILFEDEECRKIADDLLSIRCPIPTCRAVHHNMTLLSRHLKMTH